MIRKPIPIPRGSRVRTIYDTKKITQNSGTLDFFKGPATGGITVSNYDQNPFPGQRHRLFGALQLQIVSAAGEVHYASDAAGNLAAALAKFNALTNGAVRVSADQDEKLMLRAPIEDYLEVSKGVAGGSSQTADVGIGHFQFGTTGVRSINDPFVLGPVQTLQAQVVFANPAAFVNDWTAITGSEDLHLRMKFHIVELNDQQLNEAANALGMSIG